MGRGGGDGIWPGPIPLAQGSTSREEITTVEVLLRSKGSKPDTELPSLGGTITRKTNPHNNWL